MNIYLVSHIYRSRLFIYHEKAVLFFIQSIILRDFQIVATTSRIKWYNNTFFMRKMVAHISSFTMAMKIETRKNHQQKKCEYERLKDYLCYLIHGNLVFSTFPLNHMSFAHMIWYQAIGLLDRNPIAWKALDNVTWAISFALAPPSAKMESMYRGSAIISAYRFCTSSTYVHVYT
mgnify:CR=1 FL=1